MIETILTGDNYNNKKLTLVKIKTDVENWNIYYLDPENNEKWLEEFPNSQFHGGGQPQLRQINKFPWD